MLMYMFKLPQEEEFFYLCKSGFFSNFLIKAMENNQLRFKRNEENCKKTSNLIKAQKHPLCLH